MTYMIYQVLGVAWDETLGGAAFTDVLATHMLAKSKKDPKGNKRVRPPPVPLNIPDLINPPFNIPDLINSALHLNSVRGDWIFGF